MVFFAFLLSCDERALRHLIEETECFKIGSKDEVERLDRIKEFPPDIKACLRAEVQQDINYINKNLYLYYWMPKEFTEMLANQKNMPIDELCKQFETRDINKKNRVLNALQPQNPASLYDRLFDFPNSFLQKDKSSIFSSL